MKDECWNWSKKLYYNGYGHFQLRRKDYIASRVAFELFNNIDLDKNRNVCHTCDNKACCNPNHLFEGSQRDNIHDMMSKGRAVFTPSFGALRRVLTIENVQEIRDKFSTGVYLQKELAVLYNVRPNHISRIVNHKRR